MSRKILEMLPKTDFLANTTQCKKSWILLTCSFYVKTILVIEESQKMQFLPFQAASEN